MLDIGCFFLLPCYSCNCLFNYSCGEDSRGMGVEDPQYKEGGERIKKREFYRYLVKKYDLPYKYIRFKMNPHYMFKADIELSMEYLSLLEDAMDWKSIKEEFEKDRGNPASIFY